MDEYSGKRAVDGIVVSRKGSGHVLRDNANNRDPNAQFCNRLGCSGRLNSRGSQNGCSEKAKSSRPSLRSSSSGKEIIGSSSRTCLTIGNGRKSTMEPRRKISSQLDTDSSETSSIQDEPEVAEPTPSPGKIHRGAENADSESDTSMEAGSSSVASGIRPQKNPHQGSGFRNRDTLVSSSISMGSKSSGQATGAGASRRGIRNLRSNSIPDALPSGCSALDSSLSKRKDIVKRRNSEGESSSNVGGKKKSGSSLEGRNSSSSHGISISDSRRARNMPPNRDTCVASVRTRGSVDGHTRTRLSNQGNGNSLSPNHPSVTIPQMLQSDIPIELNDPSSSHQLSAETPSSRAISFSRPGSSSESLHGVLSASPTEVGISRSLMNQNSIRRYNIDGIAEILMALERIEQDEELTYEHRDMRLDIDNMSYEELLALEERMGTVSTALPEEAMSECLKKSIYESIVPKDEDMGCSGDKDDVKCSICQEEYVVGDEMGRLQCQHLYHLGCIQQWLRLKNWCPICKASAAPSLSLLTSS
ncbi:hypothetical protein F2P56_026052 [Juglans regia]|uniref:RING-type E3 ubiquitin transferase n=2 Tax=Juglans regia TaxID=51240 RepID=A0A2I4GP13_JUGRE|nr:E3 ubiquitin-protein ligase MBR2-like isoform X2 [Juglans regia]XP_035538618.1 E3 ubiquitin-protein ligase MBR2-like isoform X2 [Juglans regia]KAF5456585.1 hypothetical protein F2P56_026052 [Juglans regia]